MVALFGIASSGTIAAAAAHAYPARTDQGSEWRAHQAGIREARTAHARERVENRRTYRARQSIIARARREQAAEHRDRKAECNKLQQHRDRIAEQAHRDHAPPNRQQDGAEGGTIGQTTF